MPGAATTKLKPVVRVSGEYRRGDARAPESCARPRQPPPAAEGFRVTLKTTRMPLVAFPGCAGEAPLLPSPRLRSPRRERGLGRDGRLERPTRAAPPLPRATGLNRGHRGRERPPGEETDCPRNAKPDPESPPRPLQPCLRSGQRARGEQGRKRSWRLPQGSRFAEKPGPRTRSVAGPASSLLEMRPRLGLGPEHFATLRQVWPPRSAPRAPRQPQPGWLPPCQ